MLHAALLKSWKTRNRLLTLAWRVRTGEREWQGSPQPESDLAAHQDLTSPSWTWDVAAGGREAPESWANHLPQNRWLSNSNIPGVKYCLLYCLSTFLFVPLIKHCYIKSTESRLQMKEISLLSTRKFSFHFPKLLDRHLGLEVTPRIWTELLLPVKSQKKGCTSKWSLSGPSLPKASNSSFSFCQNDPVKTIH